MTFTGRELAHMLNIGSVDGRFYQRLKIAIDRFIPLRFRAITETESQEDVKWLNVFQEASFSLDRTTGRCTGSITWTDKLIQSMDCGFFRFLDSSRYMKLDGLTAKHLYRHLASAFEKTPVVVVDTRQLARQHLGILNLPEYFSRLMQTLEPALDQLIRNQVLGSYHVVEPKEWSIALHRHADYAPESATVLQQSPRGSMELWRAQCAKQLEEAGIPPRTAALYAESAEQREQLFVLKRAARILEAMRKEEVLPHVAVGLITRSLETAGEEGRELLDWCEIAVEVCLEKKQSRQQLKNPAGLLVKLIKDTDARQRFVSKDREESWKRTFRQREQTAARQHQEAEQQELILEYEQFRQQMASNLFRDLPDSRKKALRKQKHDTLRPQERFQRISVKQQEQEIDDLIRQDLASREAPSFERWHVRQRAQQAVLPFFAEVFEATLSPNIPPASFPES